MSSPDVPGEAHTLDTFWAEYGGAAPRPPDGPPPARRAGPGRGRLLLGSSSLLAAAACCGYLVVSGRGASDPVWQVVAGCAFAAAGATAGVLLLAPRPAAQRARPRPPQPPPLLVLHGPPPEPAGRHGGPLEDRLLELCRQDRAVFQRLLDHERSRHPCLPRADLLRLAIRHFERDHR